ncbi:LacI family transcriptional regulator [Aestuariimicrobium sp. p3-SID1156]|uniref:LacI family DNA-binding transcriptional regulator n=1 Tax=Aestuariimicrobium sp. p3-SID1156 TaxID=2916038 RepID=UPI00223A99A2|nr:LacI family DNA-binding transcriptional regulator [Aestuariimicrobium sp. p3-SID1156]MCT1460069.1 LacI family transcriptional regulator [Aestuariimicrobium sp. p3-SID1156]
MTAPKRRKQVTIYDVAEAAGVSPSTVSRTFSRPGRVNTQTSALIRETAARLGYRSKPVIAPEIGVTKHSLALVVADITNPVYAHIMRGFQQEASEAGYTVLLLDTQEDGQAEYDQIQSILPLVDGLALSASRLTDSAINQVVKIVPVVATNRVVTGVPSVIPDSGRGMRRAVEHLAELGHSRLTYLPGPEASWANGVRWRAAADACHELSIPLRRTGPGAPSVQGGVQAAEQWRAHPTTGVIAFNDIMAIGFMKAVQAMGLRIPEDVSVVGVDNSISSVLTSPTLTTVSPQPSLIGARAAKALLHQLRHRSSSIPETIVVPMGLIPRESSGPATAQPPVIPNER